MSQEKQILAHLKRKAITPIEALERYGCFRLAARIHDLRDKGHDIQVRMVERGEKVFAQYSLKS